MSDEQDGVLRFSRNNMTQSVGVRRTCWDLARAALDEGHADARGADAYIWGNDIGIAEAGPGDIIQFRSAAFTKTITMANGQQLNPTRNTTGVRHTAIIQRSLNRGRAFAIIHQNYGVPWVNEMEWYFTNCTFTDTNGDTVVISDVVPTARFYRPVEHITGTAALRIDSAHRPRAARRRRAQSPTPRRTPH